MKVFLSFADANRATATEVQLAIRGGGHELFFDESSLPPGGGFHTRIRQAIEWADLFVFLVSPESVAPGAYTLSELAFAEKKWPHPRGHVLPVQIVPTPRRAIPAYLRAVTIQTPKGNIAAEVAAIVDNWTADHVAAVAPPIGDATGLRMVDRLRALWADAFSRAELLGVGAASRGGGCVPAKLEDIYVGLRVGEARQAQRSMKVECSLARR